MNQELTVSQPRVLAVIQAHPQMVRVLRRAKKRAQEKQLSWEVLLVETPEMARGLSRQEQEYLLEVYTLAQQMGAVVCKRPADNLIEGVLAAMSRRAQEGIPIESVVLGDRRHPPWLVFGRRTMLRRLQQRLGESGALVLVPLDDIIRVRNVMGRYARLRWHDMVFSALAAALATGCILLLSLVWPDLVGSKSQAVVYALTCALVAARLGFPAGLMTAIISFAALDILFIQPHWALVIPQVEEASYLLIFICSALLMALLGSKVHQVREALTQRADRLHALLRIHRMSLAKHSVEDAIRTLEQELCALLKTDVVIFLPSVMDEQRVESFSRPYLPLSDAERRALSLCWQESKTTGCGAPYNPGCEWRFEPLITADDEIGVLGTRITRSVRLDVEFGNLLASIANQVALILERLQTGRMAEEGRVRDEREKLRSMLLSSVSHDLKTPLASIIGSLSVYRSMGAHLQEEQRQTLITTALEEAQRLDSFITNILDMTRIESGQIEMKEEWVRPQDLIAEVRKRLRDRLRSHELRVSGEGDAEVLMDMMMTSQVLQNLLDNAAKYTPAGTAIELDWKAGKEGFVLTVRDHGRGIPLNQLDKVFDKYERLKQQDHQIAGTGLGLAIARAVMQQQGGSIGVANHSKGGAVFTMFLPRVRQGNDKKAA